MFSVAYFLQFIPRNNHVRILIIPHACYMLRPLQTPRFFQPNCIWCRQQAMKLQSPSVSCYFLFLRTKYFLSTLFKKTLNLYFSSTVRIQIPPPYKTAGKTISLTFSLYILRYSVRQKILDRDSSRTFEI